MISLLPPAFKGLKLLLAGAVMWRYITDVLKELHKVFSSCLKHLLMDLQKLLKSFHIFKEAIDIFQKKRERGIIIEN